MRKRLSQPVCLTVVSLLGAAVACWALFGRHTAESARAATTEPSEGAAQGDSLRVEAVHPQLGGLERTVRVPATVIAFESANMFVKLSGYLKSQPVDIGDRVHAGQVLAEIDSPEYVKAFDQAKAAVDQAKAQVVQAEAHVTTAEADRAAASTAVTKAEAEIRRYRAARELSEKQDRRIKDLYALRSIEQRLVDEQESELQAARAAEDSAVAGAANAKALLDSAAARVAQAKADALVAHANVEVAKAACERAGVLAGYLKITAPFDGVVTKRNFFRGTYISSADQTGVVPLLTIDRTDRVRVVVQVPDCDVPSVRLGSPATVSIDALPDAHFTGRVSRLAAEEHSETRTMRAEIDLENDQGILCHGMYGYASIDLPRSAKAMRIPSRAVVKTSGNETGTIHVVKDGLVRSVEVRLGRDDGNEVEVLSGLSAHDEVVTAKSADLSDGAAVAVDLHDGPSKTKRPKLADNSPLRPQTM